jgi:uroporphyrinogen decarboxylase
VEEQIKAWVRCYKKLGIDMSFVILPGPSFEFAKGRDMVESPTIPAFKVTENTWIDEWGRTYRYMPETDQAFMIGFSIKDEHDIDAFDFPKPNSPGRLSILKFAKKAMKALDHQMAITCWVPGPFEHTNLLMGLDKFIVLLYNNPRAAEKLMDIVTDFALQIGQMFIEEGADVIDISDDCAYRSGPMIHPNLYRKFIVPRVKRIAESFHSRGVKVILHSDGNLNPIMDDLVSTGIDGLHSIEPQSGMDLGLLKRKYGGKICLLGNIDTSQTLPFGTTSDVEEEVKRRIREAGPGGGYILSSCNSISIAVPPKNVIAMFRAARRYGRYPLKTVE